jgi:hypothetical protein
VACRKITTKGLRCFAAYGVQAAYIGGVWLMLGIPCRAQEQKPVERSNVYAAPQNSSQSSTTAQPPQEAKRGPSETDTANKKKRVRRGSFVVAPLPISSPAIGSGLVPVLGYIFPLSKNDKISPP